MNKIKVIVPAGIKFLSDWKDMESIIPQGHVIINKTLTGCGFTEWVIKNSIPMIWCSPRKVLLENKEEQHPGEIYYARSLEPELAVDKDLSKEDKKALTEEPEKYEFNYEEFEKGILDAYYWFIKNGKCPKFCVTNDSFRKLKDVLVNNRIFDQFVITSDEMQVIFQDGIFKSDTELEFIYALQECSNVWYVSATPMIEEYLDEVDEFKSLPYLEFDWETAQPGRIIKAKIKSNPCASINSIAKKYISSYQQGKFEKKVLFDSSGNPTKTVESKELVIYINSVKNIGDIIRQNKLTVENTAVICANNRSNRRKVREAFRKSYQSQGLTSKEISQILPSEQDILSKPTPRGEQNKMFTLCTKTTYIGADFYSTCARTLILSDANAKCMIVDITLDLPQIMGRQRDEENPWKYEADLWYKLGPGDKTEEEFNAILQEKLRKTNSLLDSWGELSTAERKSDLAREFEKVAKFENYKDHYIAVNHHAGSNLLPCLNNLVYVAEKRAFVITNIDYANRFSVMATIDSLQTAELSKDTEDIALFILRFNSLAQFSDKMRLVCEKAMELNPESNEYFEFLKYLPNDYGGYLNTLGPEVILGYSCRKSLIEEAFQKSHTFTENLDPLTQEVFNNFIPREKYSKAKIKEILKEIYSKLGIKKTAKASDIEEWFEVKSTSIYLIDTKKNIAGFEIIKKK